VRVAILLAGDVLLGAKISALDLYRPVLTFYGG
jgi:hypothetical protein